MPNIGDNAIFHYGHYGHPDSYPEYSAHRGSMVTVMRELTDQECDRDEVGRMFEVMAPDGWRGHAFIDELEVIPED